MEHTHQFIIAYFVEELHCHRIMCLNILKIDYIMRSCMSVCMWNGTRMMGSMLLQINNDRLISPNVHSIHKMMNDPMLICNMKPHLKC